MDRRKWANWHESRKHKKYSKRLKAARIKNKKLVKKYPWLKPYQYYRKRHLDAKYDYTYLNWGYTYGWDIAFGDMFMRELGEASKDIKGFGILQTKEKYGEMRCYTTGTTKEGADVIRKYAYISMRVCVCCGKPDVPMLDTGWISPECFDCFKKQYKDKTDDDVRALYEECIIDKPNDDGTYQILPTYSYTQYSEGNKEVITHDISETVKAVRERYEKRRKKYERRIHSKEHIA